MATVGPNGEILFGVGINNEGLVSDADASKKIISGIADSASADGKRMSDALKAAGDAMTTSFSKQPFDNLQNSISSTTQRIQQITSKGFGGNLSKSMQQVSAEVENGFSMIDQMSDTNRAKIKQLESVYAELKSAAADAFSSGTAQGDKNSEILMNRANSVEKEIVQRKQLQGEIGKTADAFAVESSKLDEIKVKTEAAANANVPFRAQLRQAQNDMRQLTLEGKQGTDEYEMLKQKIVTLTNAMRQQGKQVKAMAGPTAAIQGLMSGMSGVTGAFTAMSGAISLFGDKNKDLQKAMLKVQSLMSITMGLQQLQLTLDKNSAFRVKTLGDIKKWWANVLKEATVAQTAENAATAAGTVASKGLTGAIRTVGVAIKNIPVIGWIITAVAALVAVVTKLTAKAREAAREQKELFEKIGDGAKDNVGKIMQLSSAYTALGDNLAAKKDFIKNHVDDFRQLGISINSVLQAENALIKNKDAFISAEIAKATAEALRSKASDLISKMITDQEALEVAQQKLNSAKKAQNDAISIPNQSIGTLAGYQVLVSSAQKEVDVLTRHIKNAKENIRDFYNSASKYDAEYTNILSKAGISGTETDAEKARREAREKAAKEASKNADKAAKTSEKQAKKEQDDKIAREKEYAKQLSEQAATSEMAAAQAKVDAMADGYDKQKAQINLDYNKLIKDNADLQKKMIDELAKSKGVDASKLSFSNLSAEQQNQLWINDDAANRKWERDMTELYSSISVKYRTYQEQLNEIAQKYSDERKAIENGGESSDVITARLALLEEAMKKEVNDLNAKTSDAALQGIDFLKPTFSNIQKMSTDAKNKVVENIRIILSALKSGQYSNGLNGIISEDTFNRLKLTPEIATQLQDIVDKIIGDMDKAPKGDVFQQLKSNIKAMKDAYNKTGDEGGKEFMEASEAAKANYDTIANEINNAMSVLSEYADKTGNEALKQVASWVTRITQNVSAAEEGAKAWGGWWGAIIGGVTNLATQIVGAIDTIDNSKDLTGGILGLDDTRIEEAKNNIDDLIDSVENYDAAARKATENQSSDPLFGWMITVNNKRLTKKYRKKLVEAVKDYYDTLNQVIVQYQNSQQGTYGEEWFVNQSEIISTYSQQAAMLKQVYDALKKAGAGASQLTEVWNMYIEAVNNANNAVLEYRNQMLGTDISSIATSLTDAIVDAFENGTDAAQKWADSVKDIVKGIVKNMIAQFVVAKMIQPIIDAWYNAATVTYNGRPATATQIMQRLLNTIGTLTDNLNAAEPQIEDFVSRIKESTDLFTTSSSNSSTSTGMQAMSQDSADELNGRFTTMVILQSDIKDGVDGLRTYSEYMLQQLTQINANTARLQNMESDISHLYSDLRSWQTNGFRIQ